MSTDTQSDSEPVEPEEPIMPPSSGPFILTPLPAPESEAKPTKEILESDLEKLESDLESAGVTQSELESDLSELASEVHSEDTSPIGPKRILTGLLSGALITTIVNNMSS